MDSDTELLQRFAVHGDETAFSRLVERHAPMIQGVALRCTGDAALAEEVTQTVFAVLVRKARALRHECPAAWLHRTAFLEARNARRKASRYQRTLHRFRHLFMTTPESGPGSATAEEITPHLDEALSRLPAKNRRLVVLRFYESKSVSEIAAATGTNEEACKKQIQRSLHRLGDLLRRRGVRTTSAGLASLLAGQSFCAVPAPAAVITAAALRTAPTLSFLTLHLMNTTTILKTSAVMLVLAAIPVTVLWQRNNDLTAQLERMRAAGPGPASPAMSGPSSAPSSRPKPAETGKPSAAAQAGSERPADTSADFVARIRSVLRGEVSEDEQLAFWQTVKSGDKLDRLIGDLQKTTTASAGDVESRLDLGLAYVAKIWSMPDGPEKAIWAGKAEGVWKEVLVLEPSNWDAQRNLAFSYSRYPDFLNKTGDAITEYQNTIALQEAAPEPRKEFADSYLEMARLQLKSGDPGSALSTLERGAAAHPDNPSITRQLDTIRASYKFDTPQ